MYLYFSTNASATTVLVIYGMCFDEALSADAIENINFYIHILKVHNITCILFDLIAVGHG